MPDLTRPSTRRSLRAWLGRGLVGRHAGRLALLAVPVTLLLIGLSLGARLWVDHGGHSTHLVALMAWKLFDLSTEQNVPTWFSSALLLLCGLLAMVVALLRSMAGQRHARHWLALALGFALLSMDETVAIHEHLQGPARRALGGSAGALLHFAWVIPGALIAAVLGLGLVAFVHNLDARVRRLFVAAAGLYAGGALGAEMLSGAVLERYGDRLLYLLVATTEETLEFSGTLLFLYALLTCLQLRRAADGSLRLDLSEAARGDAAAAAPRATRGPLAPSEVPERGA